MIGYFTDGSASPNPGPGGFAVIKDGKPYLIGGEPKGGDTTNIRMEGLAIVAALRDANGAPCKISSDSEFWINVITKWGPAWQKNNWKKKNGEIKNLDIVQEVMPLYAKSEAELVWVRGHAGNELNELADVWANEARKRAITEPVLVASLATANETTVTDAADEADRAWQLLAGVRVMQLATHRGDDIWAASVYFVADPASRTICWLSEPQRRHSQMLDAVPRAAFAVAIETDIPVVGVQGTGSVQVIQDQAIVQRVMKHYEQKYAQGADFAARFEQGVNKHQLYALSVDELQLFDERSSAKD